MEMKAAIFDMDGTLVDSMFLWDVLWEALGERYLGDKSFKPTDADSKTMRTLTLKDAMELVHSRYQIGESGEVLLQIANELIQDFYATQVKLKPGVRDFLEYCKANGVKMCVASATALELVSVAMNHCGISDCFLKIFSCAELGKGKEEPDIFLHAAAFLGEDIRETWVFEDSLTAIETATKIGMPTVGIYDRYNYGHDRMRAIATEYIAPGETLMKIVR